MAIHVTEQLRTFLLSILLGLGAGVLYDLLRAVRLRHPRLTAPLDLLYCQAVGLAVFLFVKLYCLKIMVSPYPKHNSPQRKDGPKESSASMMPNWQRL